MIEHAFDPLSERCYRCGKPRYVLDDPSSSQVCANDARRRDWLITTPHGEIISIQSPVYAAHD